jgi:hypothetical protein
LAGRTAVTRTIRLDGDTDRALSTLAEKERVSVNFLVNRALRKFIEWDVYAEKFGFVSMPASLITKMMSYLSDEEAKEMGRWAGQNLVKDFLTFWFKEVSVTTLVKGYPALESKYGKSFEYEEHVEGGRWTIILKHGRGAKWSYYYEELLRSVFEQLLKKEVKTERTEDQVVARFSAV